MKIKTQKEKNREYPSEKKIANRNLEKGPILGEYKCLYVRHWSKTAIAIIESQIRELQNGDFSQAIM